MGGGAHYPYPKWVWTPYGGWWPLPAAWKRNMAIHAVGVVILSGIVIRLASDKEYRFQYPDKWVPSMLYARDFHDPAFVAAWKKQLAAEGREWIEPIPTWWPKWLPPYRKESN